MIDLIGEGSFGKASKHRPADANATVMCMGGPTVICRPTAATSRLVLVHISSMQPICSSARGPWMRTARGGFSVIRRCQTAC